MSFQQLNEIDEIQLRIDDFRISEELRLEEQIARQRELIQIDIDNNFFLQASNRNKTIKRLTFESKSRVSTNTNTLQAQIRLLQSKIEEQEKLFLALPETVIPVIIRSEEIIQELPSEQIIEEQIIIEDLVPVMDESEIIVEKKDNTLRNALLIGGALLIL